MTELEAFATHATRMARATHKPDCRGSGWTISYPLCPGCVTDADRELWTRLAEEVTLYLNPTPPDEDTLL